MKIQCPRCTEWFEGYSPDVGDNVECPSCGQTGSMKLEWDTMPDDEENHA